MPFTQPVSDYMTRDVEAVGLDASLPDVARRLDEHRISAVPVVDDRGSIVGVVSRADLLRVGRVQAGSHRKAAVLTLPHKRAAEVMSQGPLVIAPDAPLSDAARTMRDHHVHRLFVVDHGRLVGVVSVHDLTCAVRDARIERPIAEIMSEPVFTVRAQEPLSVAVERLDRAHISGVVVVDDDWPVGVFTQIEAMSARDLARDTRVDDVLEPSIICMPVETRAHRAAAQAARLDVRRVIACRQREAVGIVTGLDFAKIVAA